MPRRVPGLLLSALVGVGLSGGGDAEPLVLTGFESERIAPRAPGVILNLAVAEDDSIAAGVGIVDAIRILSASGEARASFETGNFVSGLVFAPGGELFASSIDRVLRLTPATGLTILSENRFHSRDLQGDLTLRGDRLFMVGHFSNHQTPSGQRHRWRAPNHRRLRLVPLRRGSSVRRSHSRTCGRVTAQRAHAHGHLPGPGRAGPGGAHEPADHVPGGAAGVPGRVHAGRPELLDWTAALVALRPERGRPIRASEPGSERGIGSWDAGKR